MRLHPLVLRGAEVLHPAAEVHRDALTVVGVAGDGGQAQEILYDPAMFDYGNSGLKGSDVPSNLGFAGFRLLFGETVFGVLRKRRSVSASLIGGIRETQEMLDFCAEHNIVSDIEMIPISEVNGAYERILKSDVRYRFVIDMASLA